MTISIEQGFSVFLTINATVGSIPTDDPTTAPSDVHSDNPASVRIVPTANPRIIRIDALSGTGANIHATVNGHNAAALVTVTPPVDRGTTSFSEPSAPFVTPVE